ncbi:hypothetical protein H0A71_21665 [Alcaligenaceae bacterium]|nr:hypothetical protein [Alcaligenaceae bacterium]
MARSKPDGHTLLLGSVGMVTNPVMLKSMTYQSKDLKALALLAVAPNVLYVHPSLPVTTTERIDEAPELPTVAESGVEGVISGSWFGIFVPTDTPEAVQQQILASIKRVADQESINKKVITLGLIPQFEDQASFKRFVENEATKWGDVIRAQNISLD